MNKVKKIKGKYVFESFDDLKKFICLKDGGLMDADEWMNIPAEGTSKTEDADFEIIEPKQIEDKKTPQ